MMNHRVIADKQVRDLLLTCSGGSESESALEEGEKPLQLMQLPFLMANSLIIYFIYLFLISV